MKILILSTNTGGGHNAAGNAMIDALTELGVRAEMVDFTSLRRRLVNRIGAQTWIRSTIHFIPGCQYMASINPRAAEGVITS